MQHQNLKILLALTLVATSLLSANAILINVEAPTGGSGGGANSSYLVNQSSDTFTFLSPYTTFNFSSSGQGIKTYSDGYLTAQSEGLVWGIDDGTTQGFNEPYFYIDKQDIHATLDFFIPVLKGKNNFGSDLGGISPSLYVIGSSATTFGSILMTSGAFTSTGADSRSLTIGYTDNINESTFTNNAGGHRFSGDYVQIDGDLRASTLSNLQFYAEVASGRNVPFGACGSYFWEEAHLMRTYFEYDAKNWFGGNSPAAYGTPIPCNGTITRVSGNHRLEDYNNSGNLDEAYANISIKLNNAYSFWGQYVEDSTLGTKSFYLDNSLSVIEGDYINVLYNLSAIGAGASSNNDFCINKISTVVTLLCEQ